MPTLTEINALKHLDSAREYMKIYRANPSTNGGYMAFAMNHIDLAYGKIFESSKAAKEAENLRNEIYELTRKKTGF